MRETHVVLLELPSLEEALPQFHSVELASQLVALLSRSYRLKTGFKPLLEGCLHLDLASFLHDVCKLRQRLVTILIEPTIVEELIQNSLLSVFHYLFESLTQRFG